MANSANPARAMTASQVRQDIYHLLDEVLRTGVPLLIERRGQRLRIVPDEAPSKLDRVTPNDAYINAEPESLVHMDWSGEWRGDA